MHVLEPHHDMMCMGVGWVLSIATWVGRLMHLLGTLLFLVVTIKCDVLGLGSCHDMMWSRVGWG